ncbi:MAG: hypothetical protein CVU64_15535 [Deltaproteobacteria bacterium HGW-Deltaproteobacteria-21]|nr:MAG: hypothetical protein CVU64_15535 [Deltaproteobacteria bacterium HGW-Deltaproteobacteria-21]
MDSEAIMNRKGLFLLLVFIFLVNGCATVDLEWPEQEPNLITVSYSIADALMNRLKTKPIPFSPIVVASFVEAGKTDKLSNFGRMMSDFIASRMSMSGFRIVEIESGDQIRLVRDGGDLILSKENADGGKGVRAQAIVIGTYTKSHGGIYVSTRIVRADNHQIISSVDLHLPLSYELMFLL